MGFNRLLKVQMKLRGISRALAVVCLVLSLTCAEVSPARANIILFDPAGIPAMIVAWAKKALMWAQDIAQWYGENVGSALTSIEPALTKQISAQVKAMHGQAQTAGDRNKSLAEGFHEAVTPTLVPERTLTCSTTVGAREASAAGTVTKNTVSMLEQLSGQVGAGTNADTTSPAYMAVEVNDFCKLGFLDASGGGRYGALPYRMGCIQDDNYTDADIQLSSLIDKLQYPLPVTAHATGTPDGHISFVGASAVNPTGVGTEMDFVAAYKFCEHLRPAAATPTHNSGKPGIADVLSVKEDRSETAMRTAAASECFRALSYRMSCPLSSKDALKDSSGASCYDAQQALCKRLTATHEEGGQNLSMVGDDRQYELALTHCDTEGISQAMYDAIMARRCHDAGYVKDLENVLGGNAAEVEYAISFECPAQELAYKKKMDDERMRLELAIQNLLKLRTVPVASGAATARIAK